MASDIEHIAHPNPVTDSAIETYRQALGRAQTWMYCTRCMDRTYHRWLSSHVYQCINCNNIKKRDGDGSGNSSE